MFRRISDWFRMKRLGEVRTAPRGVRGRVFAKKNPTEESGDLMPPAKAIPQGHMKLKVIRKDGTVEYYDADTHVSKARRRRR
jgi:hypothetical protein